MRLDRTLCLHLAVLLGATALAVGTARAAALPASPPEAARQQALVHMVRQDCGACHGMKLSGGLGPSLLPQRLAGLPDEALVATIEHGRPGTAMPPWQGFLAEGEAAWIVARLKEGFPPLP